ncbi:MAG: hypothetical protein E2604_13385, partial [Flavobacterium sp.]|nr:hypothetical protein [Flavobacterium sp.]
VEGVIPILRENYQPKNSLGKLSGLETQSLTPGVPTGSSTEVGLTEGTLSVSASGAANYTIPISVLPGLKGIAPQISLVYDSQSGNNIAGYSWSLSGVSVITRVNSNKFHDDSTAPVAFNSQDRFALDGERLLLKSGSVYGADGAIYETANFSNVKITSYGVSPYGAAYGPQYFVVEYPDGSKAQYGNTSASRSQDRWSIDYWENPQGIRINYTYDSTFNTSRLLRITYGTIGTTPGINTITFGYKARTRSESAYIAGIPFTQSSLLNSIQVTSSNGTLHRGYDLVHDANSLGYDRLISITESTNDGGTFKSLNPTVFTYDNTPETVTFNPITTNLSVNDISYRNAAAISGDFNGDGKMDIILYPTYGPDFKKKYWLFTNFQEGSNNIGTEVPVPQSFDEMFPVSWLGGDQSFGYKLMQAQGWTLVKTNTSNNVTTFSTYAAGTAAPVYFQYSKTYEFPKFVYGYFKEPCNPGGPTNPNDPVYVEIVKDIPRVFLSGDFNGDGLTDVMVVNKSVSYSYTQGCTNYNQTRLGGTSYFVNLDKRLNSNFVNIAGQMTTTDVSDFRVVDYNGDGKADILVFDSGKVTIYTLNNNNQLTQLLTYSDAQINPNYPILIGDYNGDGKADFIIPTGNGNNNYVKFTSNGLTFIKATQNYNIPYIPSTQVNDCSYAYYIIPNDFNDDGKTDLIYVENTGCINSGQATIVVQYFKNTGSNFTSTSAAVAFTPTSSTVDRFSLPVFLSYDKINSSQDISFISKNNIFNFKSPKSNVADTKLRTITLGNGVKDAITYSPLVAPDTDTFDFVYDDSPYVENYPNADIIKAPSITVVSQLERQSKNEYKKQDYKY